MKLLVLSICLLASLAYAKHYEERKPVVLSPAYTSHIQAFKDAFDDLYAERPTGRPDFRDFMHKVEKKFKEVERKMKSNITPDRHGHLHGDEEYKKAQKQLKKQKEEAKHKVEQWKKQVEADLKKMKKEEEMKALAALLKFVPPVPVDDLLASRPTGRPDIHKVMKALEERYKEAKEQLKALRPTGRPYTDNHKLYKHAYDMLKDRYNNAWEKVEAWKKQVDADKHKDYDHHKKHDHDKHKKKPEHQTGYEPADSELSASLANHAQSFMDSFDDMFAQRPTGRPTGKPDVDEFKKALEKKYYEAKKNLKGLRPTGKPSKGTYDAIHDAERLLKDHYNDAWEKVEAWKKQVDANKYKDYDHHKKHDHDKHKKKPEHQTGYEPADSELSASLANHAQSFKDSFDDMFAQRPTGRPTGKQEVDEFKKALEKKYYEAKKNLKGLRPTGKPSKGTYDAIHDAERLLKDHYNNAWEKVEAWKKQVDADKHKDHDHHKKHDYDHHKKYDHDKHEEKPEPSDETEVISSSFVDHAQAFKDAFDDMFANRPTGRPNLRKFKVAVNKKYKEIKQKLAGLRPTGGPSQERKDHKAASRLMYKHLQEAKNKLNAWAKQAKADDDDDEY